MKKSNRARTERRRCPGDDIMCTEVRMLESAAHYHGAIGEALGRAASAPGTLQAERLSALIEAIEEYESRHGHQIAEDDRLSVSIRRLRVKVGIE